MEFNNESILVDCAKGRHGTEMARQAWTWIYARYAKLMRYIVAKTIEASHLVDEILQIAIEKAIRAIATFESRDKLRSWLCTIARTTAFTFMRDEKRYRYLLERVELEETVKIDMENAAAPLAENLLWRTRIAEAFRHAMRDSLTDGQCVIFPMCAEGNSYVEIGEFAGIATMTVGSRYSRAREKLRREIRHHLAPDDL